MGSNNLKRHKEIMSNDQNQKRAVIPHILSWIDALPPLLPISGVYWRVYKHLPFIAGVVFTVTGLLELATFHSVSLVLITAIWYVGVFFLIAWFMARK